MRRNCFLRVRNENEIKIFSFFFFFFVQIMDCPFWSFLNNEYFGFNIYIYILILNKFDN